MSVVYIREVVGNPERGGTRSGIWDKRQTQF